MSSGETPTLSLEGLVWGFWGSGPQASGGLDRSWEEGGGPHTVLTPTLMGRKTSEADGPSPAPLLPHTPAGWYEILGSYQPHPQAAPKLCRKQRW